MTQGSRFSKIACFEGSGYLGNKIFVSKKVTTTPPKTNSSHLNSWMVGIVVSFWGWPIFRCYVCFREGSWWLFSTPIETYGLVKLGSSSPTFRGENLKQYSSCHHPEKINGVFLVGSVWSRRGALEVQKFTKGIPTESRAPSILSHGPKKKLTTFHGILVG